MNEALKSYFTSGWAFLVPYALGYIAYAWLKLPVQEVDGTTSSGSGFPSLLQLYWVLHVIHLALAVHVIRLWWQKSRSTDQRQWDVLAALPSWILLGLFFWLPGTYFEFPADPWEHFARVTEWSTHAEVMQHSIWNKSNYFLGYSFLGASSAGRVFDLYTASCCLLLCWQYFRLALATGLGRGGAMIFVLLQAVLIGNNVFGFYRYYGMTGALFSQVAAIALIRLTLETGGLGFPQLLRLAGASIPLALIISLNHVQGIGIAALGIAGVILWCLLRARPLVAAWGVAGIAGLNIAVLLIFSGTDTVRQLREAGWLNSWGGFNLLSISPALDRSWQILGFLGALNLAAGILLLRANRVTGWLTWAPLLLFLTPAVAIPFSLLATRGNPDNIVTFHRLLFSIPAGLALVDCFQHLLGAHFARGWRSAWAAGLAVGTLVLLVCVPAGRGGYNRLWQSLMVPPDDLSLAGVTQAMQSQFSSAPWLETAPRLLAPRSLGFIARAHGVGPVVPYYTGFREIMPHAVPTRQTEQLVEAMHIVADRREPALLWLLSPTHAYSPGSQAAFLSRHWTTHEVALLSMGEPELARDLGRLGVATLRRP